MILASLFILVDIFPLIALFPFLLHLISKWLFLMQLSLPILILIQIISLITSYGVIRGSQMRLNANYEKSLSITSSGKGVSDNCISCIIWWRLGEDKNQSILACEKLKNLVSTKDNILKTTLPHYMFNISNPSWYSWLKYNYFLGTRTIIHIEIIYGHIQKP